MSAAAGRDHDPQQREGQLNRRNALFTAMITTLGTLGGALIGALVTAHSGTVINILGGQAAPTPTASQSPNPATRASGALLGQYYLTLPANRWAVLAENATRSAEV